MPPKILNKKKGERGGRRGELDIRGRNWQKYDLFFKFRYFYNRYILIQNISEQSAVLLEPVSAGGSPDFSMKHHSNQKAVDKGLAD